MEEGEGEEKDSLLTSQQNSMCGLESFLLPVFDHLCVCGICIEFLSFVCCLHTHTNLLHKMTFFKLLLLKRYRQSELCNHDNDYHKMHCG